MKRSLHPICALGVAAALGGCAGTAGVPAMGLGSPAIHVAAHTRKPAVVFIADLSNNVPFYSANIHAKNPPQLGEITKGVTRSSSVRVDTHHVLYVLNNGGSRPSIEEYKPGSSTPFKLITKSLFEPADVAVDTSGTLYVDDANAGQPVLYEYANGSSTPTKTISLPQISGGSFGALAFDPQHDLFLGASAREGLEQFLYEIPAGSTQAKQVTPSGYPGSAIAIDGAGNLYACGASGDIAVYKPGATSPSYTANAKADVFGGITVTANGTLYVPSYYGQLFEFAPLATTPTNSFLVVTGAFGAAVGLF